jgi:hypothetical protein
MRSRSCGRGGLALLGLGLVLSCAGEPPPAPTPPPVREHRAAPVPDEAAASDRIDRLCRSLRQIVAAEPSAYQDLRGERDGPRSWTGLVVPLGMSRCTVEGDYYPGATYVCRGEQSLGGNGVVLERAYRRLADDLDRCLGRPGWGERGWQRGQTFTFAGGERLITWRYGGNVHRPAVTLKIEEDIGRDIHFLRLAVMTMR